MRPGTRVSGNGAPLIGPPGVVGGGEGGVARASGLSGLTYMDGACEQTLPTDTYVAALAGVPTWLRATGQRSRADDQIMPPGRAW